MTDEERQNHLMELQAKAAADYRRDLPLLLAEIGAGRKLNAAHHVTQAASEIVRLRNALNGAVSVLRAMATHPDELNPGYDHYALCRETARLAAENLAKEIV